MAATTYSPRAEQNSFMAIMFEIVAVPEPSTWVAAVLALGVIGFSQRKRVRACASFAVKKHF